MCNLRTVREGDERHSERKVVRIGTSDYAQSEHLTMAHLHQVGRL